MNETMYKYLMLFNPNGLSIEDSKVDKHLWNYAVFYGYICKINSRYFIDDNGLTAIENYEAELLKIEILKDERNLSKEANKIAKFAIVLSIIAIVISVIALIKLQT